MRRSRLERLASQGYNLGFVFFVGEFGSLKGICLVSGGCGKFFVLLVWGMSELGKGMLLGLEGFEFLDEGCCERYHSLPSICSFPSFIPHTLPCTFL